MYPGDGTGIACRTKLIASLRGVAGLSDRDRASLKTYRTPSGVLRMASTWRAEGRPVSCSVVMGGLLSRQRAVSDRNQITSFYVPGDIPDLHTLHLPEMDRDLCCIGASTIALVPH